MPRISNTLICALHAAGIIRTISQTVICYFIRHEGGGKAFHTAAAPLFDTNQRVFGFSLDVKYFIGNLD